MGITSCAPGRSASRAIVDSGCGTVGAWSHRRTAELAELPSRQAELFQRFTAMVVQPEHLAAGRIRRTQTRPPRRWIRCGNTKPAGQRITPDAIADSPDAMLACQNTNTRCGNNVTFHQRSLPYAHSHLRCAERRRDRCRGRPVTESVAAAFPQTSTVVGDILTRSTRALTWIVRSAAGRRGSCPTVSPRSSRRSPDYRRWTPTTGPASTSATPPPGLSRCHDR